MPFAPCGGSLDGGDDSLNGLIAEKDRRWIQSSLAAVVVGIEVAECSSVAPAVLIVALVGRDEGKIREVAGSQIAIQSGCAIEGEHLIQAQHGIRAFLNSRKVNERIVLDRVQLHNVARGSKAA